MNFVHFLGYDFLADWVQHIPRARQHQVTYAGHFANALGHLIQQHRTLPHLTPLATLPRSGPGRIAVLRL